MEKTVSINRCQSCPFFSTEEKIMMCSHPYWSDKPIYSGAIITHDNKDGIPELCPLREQRLTVNYKLVNDVIGDDNTLFIDMDGVLCDFIKKATELLGDHIAPEGTPERKMQLDECQSIPHFYRELEPMPGAIEAFHKLSEHYDIYLLSAPSWDNVDSYTDKRIWVQKHLGEKIYKKLILSHNKGFFIGKALIDDRTKYDVLKFRGEHVHFGTPKFPNWDSVLDYLLPKEESLSTSQQHSKG
jgi:5'(3')-deoxyribonucleotidase